MNLITVNRMLLGETLLSQLSYLKVLLLDLAKSAADPLQRTSADSESLACSCYIGCLNTKMLHAAKRAARPMLA